MTLPCSASIFEIAADCHSGNMELRSELFDRAWPLAGKFFDDLILPHQLAHGYTPLFVVTSHPFWTLSAGFVKVHIYPRQVVQARGALHRGLHRKL